MGLEPGDLRGVHVRDTETADEPLPVERGQGIADVGGVGQRVGAVQKQDVEDVGAQPLQTLLDPADDGGASQVVQAGPGPFGQADAALGLQGDPLTQSGRAGQDLAEDRFRLSAPVDVGMVERGDAAVQRRLDSGLRRVDVGGRVGLRVPASPRPMQPKRRRWSVFSGVVTGSLSHTYAMRCPGTACEVNPRSCSGYGPTGA